MSATNSRIWLALDGCFFFLSLEADFTASLLSRLLISPTVPQHVRIPSVELKTSILVVALVICTYLSLTNPAIAKDERAINVAATQAVDSQNTPLAAPEPGQALAQPTLPIKTADVGTEPGSIGDKSQATTNSVVGSTVEDSGSKPEAVNGASSDATLADAQTPASADNQQKATTKSKSNGVMNLLKSNVVQTFELDPRLQKDLTEGDPLLRPDHADAGLLRYGLQPIHHLGERPGAALDYQLQQGRHGVIRGWSNYETPVYVAATASSGKCQGFG